MIVPSQRQTVQTLARRLGARSTTPLQQNMGQSHAPAAPGGLHYIVINILLSNELLII
jgi:hypothetical protein